MARGGNTIPLREKVAYGMGDFGNGLIFNGTTTYLMFFYTEHLGLTAAAASLLLLIARFWDALIDPMMGVIADRTRSRWGRFRPYLLFIPVPLVMIAALAYSVPPLSYHGRLIWAYGTHLLLMAFYTAVNIPYGALPTAITREGRERAELTSFRMSGSFTSGIIINLTLLPIAQWYATDRHDAGGGYGFAVGITGLLAILAYWLCFAGTKERVHIDHKQPDLRGDLLVVARTPAWWCLLAMGSAMFALGIFPFYSGLYFLKYVFGNEAVAPAYFTCATLGMLAGALINLVLVKHVNPRHLAVAAAVLSATAAVLVVLLPSVGTMLLYLLTALSLLSVGVGAPILWAMVGDCSDAIELSHGRSVAGLTTSAVSFSMKLGLGIGGALVGLILSLTGFVAGAAQNETSLTAMHAMVSLVPAAGHAIFAALILLFPISTAQARRNSAALSPLTHVQEAS